MPNYLDANQVTLIVQKLLSLTYKGAVTWESVDNSPYHFYISVPDFRYEIASRDADDSHPFQLKVRQRYTSDENKRMIRTLQTIETGDAEYDVDDDLEALYQAAQRQALGLDGVANEILSSLDAIDPASQPPF